MNTVGRGLEILLGLFFVATAAMKAHNMEAFAVSISVYGVLKDPTLVQMSAYLTVLLETLLGAAFLARWRFKGGSFMLASAVTFVFSGLIVYGWAFKGLKDCGCFGEFIQMGPAASLLKNAALLLVLGAAGYATRSPAIAPSEIPNKNITLRWAVAVLSVAIVITTGLAGAPGTAPASNILAAPIEGDENRPFQKFRFDIDGQFYDLGTGEYLVAFLSATCDHCQHSVPELNKLAKNDDAPEVIALMLGNDLEMQEFTLITEPVFLTLPIKPLDFFEFIDSAPPRLIHTRDGAMAHAWEWQDDVPTQQILASLHLSADSD